MLCEKRERKIPPQTESFFFRSSIFMVSAHNEFSSEISHSRSDLFLAPLRFAKRKLSRKGKKNFEKLKTEWKSFLFLLGIVKPSGKFYSPFSSLRLAQVAAVKSPESGLKSSRVDQRKQQLSSEKETKAGARLKSMKFGEESKLRDFRLVVVFV